VGNATATSPFLYSLIVVEKIVVAIAAEQALKRKVRTSATNFATATEQALKRKVRRSATNSTALAQDIYES